MLKENIHNLLWYIYTMEYYSSIKKECMWISWTEMNEPRAYYTEWSKLERERQILYINACVWNLERSTDEPIFRKTTEMQIQRTDL